MIFFLIKKNNIVQKIYCRETEARREVSELTILNAILYTKHIYKLEEIEEEKAFLLEKELENQNYDLASQLELIDKWKEGRLIHAKKIPKPKRGRKKKEVMA